MLNDKIDNALRQYSISRVYHGENVMTYAELFALVEKHILEIKKHSNEGQAIIISLDKSFESLALVLACIVSNRIYIAVDSNNPSERLAQIIEQSKPAMMYSKNGSTTMTDNKHVYDPACCSVLFTSGSTGTPKGVMVRESGLEVFAEWAISEFDLNNSSRILSVAGFHFDLSTLDIFAGILSGADIVLLDSKQASNPKYVNQVLLDKPCSLIYATPSWYTMQLNFGGFKNCDFDGTCLFAGEVFPIQNLNKLKQYWTDASYYNLYGPSETNVVSYYRIPDKMEDRTSPYPIGKACPYANLKSDKGELLIGGATLMLGYVGNHKPIGDWYRSGDMVEEENGIYTYLGRVDRMIKHRGNRIEPAEIERLLQMHPAIESVHVFRKNELLIAAYSGEKVSSINLKQYCAKNLLSYMIPDSFEYLSAIPFNANGKMDTKAVEEMIG